MKLRLPSEEELRAIYENTFTVSFPPEERKPLSDIRRMWHMGRYLPWVLDGEEGPIGSCFLWKGRPGWLLLDYLCVEPSCRNAGVGSLLLKLMREQEPGAVILCESEAVEYAPDRAMAERRLGFYRRNGAYFAGYDLALFGVHYNTLYWADAPVADDRLLEEHRSIYRDSFPAEKYARNVRIPWDPAAEPLEVTPWQ